jgi:hypothetical protein
MNKITPTPQGEPCGSRVEINSRKVRCKFHFGLDCFTSVAQMKALVRPDPRDGSSVAWWHEPGSVEYDILCYSLDGSPARGEYPAEDPLRFQREARIHQPTGFHHYGWTPVWAQGLTWPYWGYQHGFGGDYYNRVLKAALRHEIYQQIEDARFGTGEGMHVHHVPPNTFAVLSSAWMGINGLFAKDVKLCEPHLGHTALADRELAFSWQDFHAQHATLEVLTPEEHRARHASEASAA